MKKDKAPSSQPVPAANGNGDACDPVVADAALMRIAEAIGRHIAREHICARKVANDNQPVSKNPSSPKR